MASKPWKILGQRQEQEPEQELTLAVRFSSTARTLAGFADLVPLLDPPLTIWETAMPTAGTVPPDKYVDWWLADVEQTGKPVRAVFGYCAGSVLAAQLAHRLAQRQPAPQLVLFDPELPGTDGLYSDFRTAGDGVAAMMAPGELDRYHAAAQRICAEFADDDVPGVGAALNAVFVATMTGVAQRLGLDDEVRAELSGVFGVLVEYLVAAGLFDPREMWAQAVAIHSAGGTADVGRGVVLDVSRDNLLRHIDTARALSGLLGPATAGNPA